MHRISSLFVMFGLLALPKIASAETFKDFPVVDSKCSSRVADAPDSHTREGALNCGPAATASSQAR